MPQNITPDKFWTHAYMQYPLTPSFQNSKWPSTGVDKNKMFPAQLPINSETRELEKHQKLISTLVTNQEKYDSPSKEDLKKVTSFNPCENMNLPPLITGETFLDIPLIIELAKKTPGFSKLDREDQALLLKSGHGEVMLLRTARKYDMKRESIYFASNGPFTIADFQSAYASVREFGNNLFSFCRTMWGIQVDTAEYALLTAIVIFSSLSEHVIPGGIDTAIPCFLEHEVKCRKLLNSSKDNAHQVVEKRLLPQKKDSPSLLNTQEVEKLRAHYINVLRAYTDIHRPGSKHFYRLLGMLPSLRTLSHMYRNLYLSIEVDITKLPPFLEEFICVK